MIYNQLIYAQLYLFFKSTMQRKVVKTSKVQILLKQLLRAVRNPRVEKSDI